MLVLEVTLLEVSEREEGVLTLHLPIGAIKKTHTKNTLLDGAGTELRTQDLFGH